MTRTTTTAGTADPSSRPVPPRGLKVLHAIPTMGGGGAERQLCYLARELVGRGCEVHVALFHGGPNYERLVGAGAQVHRLRASSNFDPRIAWQISGLIRRLRPDLVQTWTPQMDVMGGLAALATRTPFIVSERGSSLAYPPGWRARLRAGIAGRARMVIANSDAGRTYWSGQLPRSTSIHVVRNAVPFEELGGARAVPHDEAPGLRPDDELILFAGRFSEEKNLSTLLPALRAVLGEREQAVALLFGEGPERRARLEQVEAYGLGRRLQMPGYTQCLGGWLSRAGVFVSVSRHEGHPNTVLEAVAHRCPVVVSDIPQHREFLDDESAELVPESDPSALASAILRILTDRDRARARAERALVKIAHLSPRSAGDQYLEHYRRALEGTGMFTRHGSRL